MAIFNGYVSHNQRVARNKVLNKWLMGRRSLLQKVLLRQKFAVSNQKNGTHPRFLGFHYGSPTFFFSPKPEQRDWLRCCEQQGHPWIDSERLSYNPADVRRHLIHPVFVSEFSSWVVSPFRLCPFRVAAFKALGRHSVSGAMTCARTTAATDIDHVSHCFVEISCPKGR